MSQILDAEGGHKQKRPTSQHSDWLLWALIKKKIEYELSGFITPSEVSSSLHCFCKHERQF